MFAVHLTSVSSGVGSEFGFPVSALALSAAAVHFTLLSHICDADSSLARLNARFSPGSMVESCQVLSTRKHSKHHRSTLLAKAKQLIPSFLLKHRRSSCLQMAVRAQSPVCIPKPPSKCSCVPGTRLLLRLVYSLPVGSLLRMLLMKMSTSCHYLTRMRMGTRTRRIMYRLQ